MIQIALYQPQIPPNTGNCIRLAANMGATLHLIGPLGFDLDEKKVRRAGLDYHELAQVKTHDSFDSFRRSLEALVDGPSKRFSERIVVCTTRAERSHFDFTYNKDDILLFGSETSGLPEEIHQLAGKRRIKIPMVPDSRSLNLSNSVAIVAYESFRQQFTLKPR